MFSGLRMFPLMATSLPGTPEEVKDALLLSADLARTRPELMTDWMWKCLIMKEPTAPASATWFYPFFPAGTIFDVEHRPYAAHGRPRFTPEQIANFRTEAPYSRDLTDQSVKALGEKATTEAIAREYGDMAAYDLSFAWVLARRVSEQPEEYARRLEAISVMSPASRSTLAEFFVDRGRIADAVAQYERWLESDGHELGVAARSDWLIRHYFETGQQEKATALAERAADVYSYPGLIAGANLHEWRGESDDAEELLIKARDRYDFSPQYDLLAFYLRHGRKGVEPARLMADLFPAGMKPAAVASLKGAPGSGVRVRSTGETGKRNGIEAGDVIVAVDGYTVQNSRQWRVVRQVRLEPEMRLIVWRGGRYREVTAPLRFNWVYGTVVDYKPEPKAPPVTPAAAAAATGGTE